MPPLFETFKARAEAVSAEVYRLATPSEALDFILEFLRAEGVADAPQSRAIMCCGMGGSYSLKLPEISAPILQRKLSNIVNTGAPIAAMDCPGCAMQIGGGFDKTRLPVNVRHTAELIADQFE